MQRWIVTGGAGFIGSNFVRLALAESDAEVTVFDKLTYAGNLASLREVAAHPRYRFVRGDIADREALRRTIVETRPTAIVNFAAESHVDRSIDGPGEFVQTNIVGAFEVLEAARCHLADPSSGLDADARRAFRLLHISTDEVYGSLGAEGAFSETTPYAPNSPYAASKAAADQLVRAYWKTYGLPVLLTNCSNNYGPFQFPEKLIPLMISNAVAGKPLPIYGDGKQIRDWIYVEDHCRGVLDVLTDGRPGEKYNLGGRAERTNLEVVDRICALLEEELPAADNPALRRKGLSRYSDLREFVTDRPGHDRRYAIDSSKVEGELGWTPRHDFDSGIRATVRWYLANQEWCRTVTAGKYEQQRLGLGGESQSGESGAATPGAVVAGVRS